jgi:hypothetical protein
MVAFPASTSQVLPTSAPDAVQLPAVYRFVEWLRNFGETSFDHQSFYAGALGGRAKSLYYRRPVLGTLAVAPMIAAEAFMPAARRLFWHRQRFPIADAHYAMGFALLARVTRNTHFYRRAVHFLETLQQTRCTGYREYCWGYPFDWVTRTGVIRAGTPLITTTPYCYEAFSCVYELDGDKRWLHVMRSAAAHAACDIQDRKISVDTCAAGYSPADDCGTVVNASAYRAFLLASAARRFDQPEWWRIAERNLNFVLSVQEPDGSWPYAVDGVRNFVDHFHTCFVLKALTKIESVTGHQGCRQAIDSGVTYYVRHLFDAEGLPKPFARAPRLTVFRRELYDYAECINLATLLCGRFALLDARLSSALHDLLTRWQRSDGSFRSRKLWFGWDNVAMHRWAQSQLFRSLCLSLAHSNDRNRGRQSGLPSRPPDVVSSTSESTINASMNGML